MIKDEDKLGFLTGKISLDVLAKIKFVNFEQN